MARLSRRVTEKPPWAVLAPRRTPPTRAAGAATHFRTHNADETAGRQRPPSRHVHPPPRARPD
eukprot:155471-Chlamydomonas_euryale.AAC.1